VELTLRYMTPVYFFLYMCVGPALAAGGYGDLKLMILDDDLLALPGWAQTVSCFEVCI